MTAENSTERSNEQGLSKAGDTLDQNVATGEKGRQRREDQLFLADKDLADLARDRIEKFSGRSPIAIERSDRLNRWDRRWIVGRRKIAHDSFCLGA